MSPMGCRMNLLSCQSFKGSVLRSITVWKTTLNLDDFNFGQKSAGKLNRPKFLNKRNFTCKRLKSELGLGFVRSFYCWKGKFLFLFL